MSEMVMALAAVLYEAGKPLVIEEGEVAAPQAGEEGTLVCVPRSLMSLGWRTRWRGHSNSSRYEELR
jgi:hypothetical protein